MLKKGRSARHERVDRPLEIGAAIAKLAQDLGIKKTLGEFTVLTSWESVVGEQIARVTQAQRIQNGVLFVGVANAPWRAELTMRRFEIAEKINHAMGKKLVREIRFR